MRAVVPLWNACSVTKSTPDPFARGAREPRAPRDWWVSFLDPPYGLVGCSAGARLVASPASNSIILRREDRMVRCTFFASLFCALGLLLPAVPAAEVEVPKGFSPLFNGKDFSGW